MRAWGATAASNPPCVGPAGFHRNAGRLETQSMIRTPSSRARTAHTVVLGALCAAVLALSAPPAAFAQRDVWDSAMPSARHDGLFHRLFGVPAHPLPGAAIDQTVHGVVRPGVGLDADTSPFPATGGTA